MSYDITIYHADVKTLFTVQAEAIFERPPRLPDGVWEWFISAIVKRGYLQEGVNRYVTFVKETPIQLSLYDTEIAISIPYWANALDAIFEASMLVSELIEDHKQLVAYDPQSGEWIA